MSLINTHPLEAFRGGTAPGPPPGERQSNPAPRAAISRLGNVDDLNRSLAAALYRGPARPTAAGIDALGPGAPARAYDVSAAAAGDDAGRTHIRSRSATVRRDGAPRLADFTHADARVLAIGLADSYGELHETATPLMRMPAGVPRDAGVTVRGAAASHGPAVATPLYGVPEEGFTITGRADAASPSPDAATRQRVGPRRPPASARLPTSHMNQRRVLDTTRPPTRQRNAFPTFLSDMELLRDLRSIHDNEPPPSASATGEQHMRSPVRRVAGAAQYHHNSDASATAAAGYGGGGVSQQLHAAIAAIAADPASARRAAFYDREMRLARQHRARVQAAAAGVITSSMAFDAMMHGMHGDVASAAAHGHVRGGYSASDAAGVQELPAPPPTRAASAWIELAVDSMRSANSALGGGWPSTHSSGGLHDADDSDVTSSRDGTYSDPLSPLHSRSGVRSMLDTASTMETRHAANVHTASDPGIAWGAEDGFDSIPVSVDVPIVVCGGTRAGGRGAGPGSDAVEPIVASPAMRLPRRPPTASGMAAQLHARTRPGAGSSPSAHATAHGAPATPVLARVNAAATVATASPTATTTSPSSHVALDARMSMLRTLLDQTLAPSSTTHAIASMPALWNTGDAFGGSSTASGAIAMWGSSDDAPVMPSPTSPSSGVVYSDASDVTGAEEEDARDEEEWRLEDTVLDEAFLSLFANGREILTRTPAMMSGRGQG